MFMKNMLALVVALAVLQYTRCGESLECPYGSQQIGELNADILGCGISDCDARYQDTVATMEDCLDACEANANCESFTWAPMDGDQNHPGTSVCTLYDEAEPLNTWGPQQIMCQPLECPAGSDQIGELNADIEGCGLLECDDRYQDDYATMQDCLDACVAHDDCVSFTWAPMNGDQNHPGHTVCTLYDSVTPNRQWAPNQIMCGLA